jgi:hypothetical protein
MTRTIENPIVGARTPSWQIARNILSDDRSRVELSGAAPVKWRTKIRSLPCEIRNNGLVLGRTPECSDRLNSRIVDFRALPADCVHSQMVESVDRGVSGEILGNNDDSCLTEQTELWVHAYQSLF